MLPSKSPNYPIPTDSFSHPIPYQQLKRHFISTTSSNEQLLSLNQQLRYQTQYLTKQVSFLNERIHLLEEENKRLHRVISEDRANTSRGGRSVDYKSELAQLLDGGKRELEKRNEELERQSIELKTRIDKYRLQIFQLQTDNFELKETLRYKEELIKSQEMMSTNSKSERVVRDSRFLKQQFREQSNRGLMESPSVTDIMKQGDSSVEGVNSSQESYTNQEVIEQLKQQNYLLRNEICENNHRYQTQIQKLNLYIDKLQHKQTQVEGTKGVISTLFNALTVSFIEFGNEKAEYQKRIVQCLNQIMVLTQRENQLKGQLEMMRNKVEFMEYSTNVLKR